MINYILQVILFQVLFLAIYDVFLSKETFFSKNRGYLLVTPILSFCIPFLKIPTFKKVVQEDFVIALPEIVLSPQKVIQTSIEATTYEQSVNAINIIFWVGVSLFALLFLLKLVHVLKLIYKSDKLKTTDATLVLLPKNSKAFSFFNFIFIGKAIKEEQKEQIIQHELVHTKQKHTLDLLFFELLKIIMWFNPMIYLYQKRITLVHEYISDEIASTKETKESYVNGLLVSFFQVDNIGFVNQFYKKSLLKKRISMIMKRQSKKINQLKYLLLVPVLCSMLFYVACSENFEDNIAFVEKKQNAIVYSYSPSGIKQETTSRQSYLDSYLAFNSNEPLGKEITEEDLYPDALNEFLEFKNNMREQRGEKFDEMFILKLYYYNERPVVGVHMNKDYNVVVNSSYTEKEELSMKSIDQVPTFPGCETGDKNCFSRSVQKHFAQTFNSDLPKTLGLSPGKKRIFVQFSIDKDGVVKDIKVRAPHNELKKEVERILELLPKVEPGIHEGKNVLVKYSLPFTIFIE